MDEDRRDDSLARETEDARLRFRDFEHVLRVGEPTRRRLYVAAGLLALLGIFAMRWNVVIGGQLFSRSFLGYTSYKIAFATREDLLPAVMLLALPFAILAGLVRLLPPWADMRPMTDGQN